MQKDKSFTIIELLVVIAIIGLLSSIVLVNMDLPAQRQKARIAKTLEFSSSIQNALGSEAVGIWTFDDQANPTNDSSGYGNNGTINGGATFTDDTPHKIIGTGVGKYSLSFNGGNYVAVGSPASLQNLPTATLEAWIKPTTLSGYNNVIGRTAYSNGGLVLRASQGGDRRLTPHVYTNTWYVCQSATTIPLNQWTYIVTTYDGATLRGYINGVQACSAVPAVGGNLLSNSANWNIGADPADTGSFFNGLIDEVRIYEKALTLGEIQKHYAQGLENHQNLAIQ